MKKKVIFILLIILFIIVISLGGIGLYLSRNETNNNEPSGNNSNVNENNSNLNNDDNFNNNNDDNTDKDKIDYHVSNNYEYYESKDYINNAEVALKNGQVASEKLNYKAVIYNGYYYFYNNGKMVSWMASNSESLNTENYGLIFKDDEYSLPAILYSFIDNKFIGNVHSKIGCTNKQDVHFDTCKVSKDVIIVSDNNKMGLMSLKDGSMILETKYNYISEDYNGSFIVSNDTDIKINSSTSLIDSKGKELIKYDKQLILSLENGSYLVVKDNMARLIDRNLNKLELKSINSNYSIKSPVDISNNYYHNLYKCNKNKKIDLDNFSYKCTSDNLILYLNEGSEMYCTSYDDCKGIINSDEIAIIYSVDINTGKLEKMTVDDFEYNAN